MLVTLALTVVLQHVFPSSTVARQTAFSPDSSIVATTAVNGSIRLYRTSDHRLARVLAHPGGVTSIAFSRDGQVLASGGYDHTVRLWRLRDGALLRTLHAEGAIWSVAFSADDQRVAGSGEDKTIRIWRIRDGAPLHVLRGHTLNVWSIDFSSDGNLLASGSFDHTIKLWRASDGALLRTLQGHEQAVVGLAFSRDSRLLASGGDDSTVRIWRARDGALLRTIDAGNHIYAVAFSPDGRTLAGAGRERGSLGTLWKGITNNRLTGDHAVTVRLWRVDNGALRIGLAAHADDVRFLAFSNDGHWLATASDDKTTKLWRISR